MVTTTSEEKTMNKSKWLLAGLTAVALAGGLLSLGSTSAAPAQASINPEPSAP